MTTTLTKKQAKGILNAWMVLSSIGASVDEIHIGAHTKFVRYAFDGGYGVVYMGSSVEWYEEFQDFTAAYDLPLSHEDKRALGL